jgi:hypothetical protein
VQKEWPSSLRTSLWPVEKVIDLRDRRRARQVEQRAAAAASAQDGGQKSSRETEGEDEATRPEATGRPVGTRGDRDNAAADLGSLGRTGSDSRAEGESGGEASCEWEDELRALVKGGVPMYLRGEVWTCFYARLSGLCQSLDGFSRGFKMGAANASAVIKKAIS